MISIMIMINMIRRQHATIFLSHQRKPAWSTHHPLLQSRHLRSDISIKYLFSNFCLKKPLLKCPQQAFFSPRTPLSLQFPEGGICNKPRKVLVVGSIPKRSRRNLEALVKVKRYHHPICWCSFLLLLFFVVDVSSKDDCSQTLT